MPARLFLSLLVLLALPASAHAQSVETLPGDLGDVVVGTRGPVVYLPVTVPASASADVTISEVTLTGANASEFAVPSASNGCSEATPAGDTCFLGVRFAPVGAAGPRQATITLRDATPADVGTIPLSGSAIAPTGPAGATGATGPRGTTGAQGPAGPRGLAGRAIQSTCTTRVRPTRTRCRIIVLPDDAAATAFRLRLLRSGKAVARGRAAREGRVRLRHSGRLRKGRYTLAITFRIDGRTVRARQVVRLR